MWDARLLMPVSGTLLLTGCEVQSIRTYQMQNIRTYLMQNIRTYRMQNIRTYQMHCVHLPLYKQMDILNALCGQNVEFINVKHCGT
jgi:ABC-type cobalamin transport system ATPase subunit